MDLDSRLLEFSKRGIFPGPEESDEAFFSRVETLSAISKPFVLFDTAPDWVEIVTKSKGLFPWEGAAVWIEEDQAGIRSCRIQLKNSFLTRFYAQDEILAHEMVHAMRLMFDERRFEEVLAYSTSKNRFRRYFGPLFSSTKETKGMLALMAIAWLFYWISPGVLGECTLLLPFLGLGLMLLRLKKSQSLFAAALRHLEAAVGANALSIALRLTDAEIERFAKSSSEEILSFAQQQKSLRWRQIHIAYFRGCCKIHFSHGNGSFRYL